MSLLLNEALRGAQALPATPRSTPRHALLVGAAGPLGAAVLHGLLGRGGLAGVQVAVSGPMESALRGLQPLLLDLAVPPQGVDTAVLVLDQARGRHGREAAMCQPLPHELPALAQWLLAGGVQRLVVVLPHAPGTLPAALKEGLASLDEQALAALPFQQLVLVRPARQPVGAQRATQLLQRLAHALLAQLHWMVPQQEQALRAEQVARFVAALVQALPSSPSGTRVAPATLLWQWARADDGAAWLASWLAGPGAIIAPCLPPCKTTPSCAPACASPPPTRRCG